MAKERVECGENWQKSFLSTQKVCHFVEKSYFCDRFVNNTVLKVVKHILFLSAVVLLSACTEITEDSGITGGLQAGQTPSGGSANVLNYLEPGDGVVLQTTEQAKNEVVKVVNSATQEVYFTGVLSDSICVYNSGTPVSVDIINTQTDERIVKHLFIPYTGDSCNVKDFDGVVVEIPRATDNVYYVDVAQMLNGVANIEVRIGDPFPYIRIAIPLYGNEDFNFSLDKLLKNRLCRAERLRVVSSGDETVLYADGGDDLGPVEGIDCSLVGENEYNIKTGSLERGLYQVKVELSGFMFNKAQEVIELINKTENYLKDNR